MTTNRSNISINPTNENPSNEQNNNTDKPIALTKKNSTPTNTFNTLKSSTLNAFNYFKSSTSNAVNSLSLSDIYRACFKVGGLSFSLSNIPKNLANDLAWFNKNISPSLTMMFLSYYLVNGDSADQPLMSDSKNEKKYFSGEPSQTTYLYSGIQAMAEVITQINEGRCGVDPNVTQIPINFESIYEWKRSALANTVAQLFRGEGQPPLPVTEECIIRMIDKVYQDYHANQDD